jgi:16S rRNA (guanine527-N7)-methyltransferase
MGIERSGTDWLPLVDGALEKLGESGVPTWTPRRPNDPWRQKIASYLDDVVEWNRRTDLTAARSSAELVDLTIADAAVVAGATADGGIWADVGSGAGAPGLVLAMMLPEATLSLYEPRDKRVAFLRSVIGKLGLSNVTVGRSRSESVRDASCDTAISRATLPPAEWLREGARISRRHVWVLLAGAAVAPESATLRVDADIRYTWPLTGAERRAARYTISPG